VQLQLKAVQSRYGLQYLTSPDEANYIRGKDAKGPEDWTSR